MCVIIEGIPSVVVELVDETDCERPKDLHRQCRYKIPPRNLVGHKRTNEVRNYVQQHQNDRCDNEIAQFQPLQFYRLITLFEFFQFLFRILEGFLTSIGVILNFPEVFFRLRFSTLLLGDLAKGY
jgi:hypothetical protein